MDIIDLIAITKIINKKLAGKSIGAVEYFPRYDFYKFNLGRCSLWISVNPKYPFVDISPKNEKGENSNLSTHLRGLLLLHAEIYQEDLVLLITLQHPLLPSKKKFLLAELQRMKTNIILTSPQWIIHWAHREISGNDRNIIVGGVYLPPPTGNTIAISQWRGEKDTIVRGLSRERKYRQRYEEILATLKSAQMGKGETGIIGNYWHIIAASESEIITGSWLHYYESLISSQIDEQRKRQEEKLKRQRIKKLKNLLKKLKTELKETENADFFLKLGNALLSYPNQLKPDGTFTFEDWETGKPITHHFEEWKEPKLLAKQCFSKYKRLKAKRDRLTMRIKELEYQLQTEIENRKPTSSPTNSDKPKHSSHGILKYTDGVNVYIVGKNAKASHTITFKLANDGDLWFHTRAYEGSHVILKGSPTQHAIEKAAKLAAYFSKAPKTGLIEVAYTERKYVKPIKGTIAGVIYKNERITRVEPANPKTLGLKPVQ